jgi:tripartite-type tricarboxylate transporter receptor subunit TctC
MRSGPLARSLIGMVALLASDLAAAQAYPSRPVTLIVPFAVGGSTDLVARLVAHELTSSLGKPVLVDNRTGGGGVIGWAAAAKASPDGHTLLAMDLSYTIAAGLLPNLPYDPRTAFTSISTAVSVPHVLVVHPSVKAKTVPELVALAKASPGKLFYGSGGNGTNTHLGAELFKSLTGTDLVHVPYKGAGAVLQDLMSGRVQMLVSSLTTTLPLVKSGKVRALVVTSERRVPVLPDVPSAPEAGVPRFLMLFWVGLAAPSGTPPAIVERLHKDVVAALDAPETKKRLNEMGLDPVGNTPAQAAKLVESEMQRWAAVIKTAHIKAE